MALPQWARKPKHRKEVVATPRGWMVKETGEYLKLVTNLVERLEKLEADLPQEPVKDPEPETVQSTTEVEKDEPETPEAELESNKQTTKETKKPGPRRGRKKGATKKEE